MVPQGYLKYFWRSTDRTDRTDGGGAALQMRASWAPMKPRI